MTHPARLQAAFQAHQRGELTAARQGYLQVLAQDPAQPDALNLLGVVHSQQREHAQAITRLVQAIAVRPGFTDAWLNLAKTLSAARRWPEALGACDVVLRLEPAHVEALSTQARVLRKLKRHEDALAHARAVLALAPGSLEMARLEASCLVELRRLEEAQACFARSLARHPGDAALRNDQAMLLVQLEREDEALALLLPLAEGPQPFLPACSNLANLLDGRGERARARALHERVVSRDPQLYAGWINYANILQKDEDWPGAQQALARAIALQPERAEAHVNLSGVLMGQQQEAAARAALRRAIELAPDFADAWNNLGAMELDAARPQQAQAAYAQAARLAPDMAAAQFGLALSCLMRGDFARGWPLYEWRWLGASQSRPKERPRFACPQWTGQPTQPAEHTLLVYHEQGFGDTVQFLRFVPALVQRFARVSLVIQPTLLALARHNLPEGIEVLSSEQGQQVVRERRFDWHCPMGSLPLALGLTDAGHIPGVAGYLRPLVRPLPPAFETLRAQARAQGRPLVGICWAGNPGLGHNKTRSMALDLWHELLASSEVAWVSLQRERAQEEAAQLAEWGVLDLGPGFADFADTAAVIAQLDLVVSVDTVIVHLAGALGTPCWLLNRFQSEWRWMHGSDRSAWYGAVRQFRQPRRHDWPPVLEAVRQALAQQGLKAPGP